MRAGVDPILEFLGTVAEVALTWLPLAVFILIAYLLWRSLSFMPRVKPAEIDPESKASVSWEDIAGVDEAAAELQ
jgi:ATP-dependent Zn protease